MSGQRQKNQPEQGVLAFPAEGRSEAPKAAEGGTETPVVKRKAESLAGTERLMEEVCELENCKQALQRVKANKGSPGVDGMTVDELPSIRDGEPPPVARANAMREESRAALGARVAGVRNGIRPYALRADSRQFALVAGSRARG